MLNRDEAKIIACGKITELFGLDYFRSHIANSFESYSDNEKDVEFEYFLGFEGSEKENLWVVFAFVTINRETKNVLFLDYKTPEGKRMVDPIKPVRLA